ncbi:MAG: hypothetical protein LBB75_01645 [Oscillospiraceae bacterium]|jgi:hypothetical protein|nr:hypothetical protein [Oscillospiraceae bacterium]
MLVRWATHEDKPAWLFLSREYDEYLSSDMARRYDGFDAALRELNPNRAITINTPKSGSPKLQNEKRFLEAQGFALHDETVIENGAPMYGMIKQPKEEPPCP